MPSRTLSVVDSMTLMECEYQKPEVVREPR